MEYVTSADGTRIAYERTGSGPPLVLVHGGINDRNAWGLVRGAFDQRFTVLNMDRRGRGESGPPAEHDLEREFEDVLAVIEAAGEPVDLMGHSYGGRCALGAAALVPERVKHLVLYEPAEIPAGEGMDLAMAFEKLSPDEAVAQFMSEVLEMPDEELSVLRAGPFWAYVTSFASAMPFEGRALVNDVIDPARFSVLTMPALFLVGSQSQERLGTVLRAIEPHMANTRWHVFEGQGHGANLTAAPEFARVVMEFLAT